MSSEAERMINLQAKAGPGVSVRILDGDLRPLAVGLAPMSVDVQPGLYMVEWTSAGTVTESLSRVGPDDPSPKVVEFLAPELVPPSGRPAGPLYGGSMEAGAVPRGNLLQLVGSTLRPSEKQYESSIAVIVAGNPGISPVEAFLGVRLLSSRDVALRANKADEPLTQLDNGEFARCYRVSPGRFNLRFRSLTGETLAQSVPAIAGRQTIVFLQASEGSMLVADGGEFKRQDGVGIDPSRTIVISVAGDEEPKRVRERVRLANVLLHDLAVGTGSLSEEFVDVLCSDKTDPLLKLYGALVAQSCLDAGTSPALDETFSRDGSDAASFRERWTSLVSSWVPDPSQRGAPTDAVALWWRLEDEAVRPDALRPSEGHVPSRISVPPMFESAWRWAITESVQRPAAVPSTASLRAATRTAGGTTPWLCWKASATKAPSYVEPRDAPRRLDDAIELVARKARLLQERRSRGAADPFSGLSADAALAVTRVVQLKASPPERRSLAEALALSLSLPAGALRRRLAHAGEELDTALSGPNPPSAKSRLRGELSSAPGLTRKIVHPDDPQKERFGGEARRLGFWLSATFQETSSSNWTRVILRVRGSAPDGTEVEFHLHDSFKPPLERATFSGRVAELVVTSWGGFTAGVWIPSLEIELELDLALIKGAPRYIRTR